jgi:hypothetical protein
LVDVIVDAGWLNGLRWAGNILVCRSFETQMLLTMSTEAKKR